MLFLKVDRYHSIEKKTSCTVLFIFHVQKGNMPNSFYLQLPEEFSLQKINLQKMLEKLDSNFLEFGPILISYVENQETTNLLKINQIF